jgi:hypothetical protein
MGLCKTTTKFSQLLKQRIAPLDEWLDSLGLTDQKDVIMFNAKFDNDGHMIFDPFHIDIYE